MFKKCKVSDINESLASLVQISVVRLACSPSSVANTCFTCPWTLVNELGTSFVLNVFEDGTSYFGFSLLTNTRNLQRFQCGGVANLAKLCTSPPIFRHWKIKIGENRQNCLKHNGKMGKIGKSGKTGKLEFYNIGQKAHFTHVITKFKTSKIPETKTTLRRGLYHALVILNNFLISSHSYRYDRKFV